VVICFELLSAQGAGRHKSLSEQGYGYPFTITHQHARTMTQLFFNAIAFLDKLKKNTTQYLVSSLRLGAILQNDLALYL
jgi:hypothetical protein